MGLVWWRLQRRAREEAARNAARVVTLVQSICVVIGVAAVALGIASRAFSFAPKELLSVTTLSQWSIPLLLVLTIWLTLAPVAVYLAVSRD